MNKETQIVMLPVEVLEHHPENPRKDIGDISELTESIKENGILQNLTVVPKPDDSSRYYIVIGNRRYEGACAAQLKELPCVISNMGHNKQLETMLIENMNRTDLTIYEQAKGFEQLIIAGYSQKNIAEKTGFSEATISRRLKLNEYKEADVIQAQERGGRLEDFIKLDKISHKKDRNDLAKLIGTADFNNAYKKIINYQEAKKDIVEMVAHLKDIASEYPKDISNFDYRYIRQYIYTSLNGASFEKLKKEVSRLQKAGEELFYKFEISKEEQYLYLYTKAKNTPKGNSKKPTEKTRAEKQYDRGKRYVNKIAKEHYELRLEFMREIVKSKKLKDYEKICTETMLDLCSRYGYLGGNFNTAKTFSDNLNMIKKNQYSTFSTENFKIYAKEYPAGAALAMVYSHLGDNHESTNYNVYFGNSDKKNFYTQNNTLARVYDFLLKLGYQISTEEQQIIDGTHPIYNVKKGEKFLEELKAKKD